MQSGSAQQTHSKPVFLHFKKDFGNQCISPSNKKKLNQTHFSFSSSGLQLSFFQSATWCWSPATPVTCPAVWTGSTSHSTQQKITWWFCVRRHWPLNRIDSYSDMMHKENRPFRHLNKGMKICQFSAVLTWYWTGTYSTWKCWKGTIHKLTIKPKWLRLRWLMQGLLIFTFQLHLGNCFFITSSPKTA